MNVTIYTDGSSSNKKGICAWAAICPATGYEFASPVTKGTNNVAELMGIQAGLEYAKSISKQGDFVEIISDSQYALKSTDEWCHSWKRKGWTKPGGPIKNLDIIKKNHQLCSEIRAAGVKLTFSWVKGHAGHEFNERADRLASIARAFE